jgi:hypothetical protein
VTKRTFISADHGMANAGLKPHTQNMKALRVGESVGFQPTSTDHGMAIIYFLQSDVVREGKTRLYFRNECLMVELSSNFYWQGITRLISAGTIRDSTYFADMTSHTSISPLPFTLTVPRGSHTNSSLTS